MRAVCNCAWSHICETDSLVPVCGDTTLGSSLRSTWGASLGEDKLGARARILNTKVARRANIPPSMSQRQNFVCFYAILPRQMSQMDSVRVGNMLSGKG